MSAKIRFIQPFFVCTFTTLRRVIRRCISIAIMMGNEKRNQKVIIWLSDLINSQFLHYTALCFNWEPQVMYSWIKSWGNYETKEGIQSLLSGNPWGLIQWKAVKVGVGFACSGLESVPIVAVCTRLSSESYSIGRYRERERGKIEKCV